MPILITKFQQKTFETAFKKQYSVINNAIDFLALDQGLSSCYVKVIREPNGNPIYSVNNADCPALKEGLMSKLKLTPLNKKYSYAKRNDVLSEGGVAVNVTAAYDSILSSMMSYMLPDGAVLMFRDDNANYYDVVCFVLDVNGEKGPNRWGYDVFWLMLSQYKIRYV